MNTMRVLLAVVLLVCLVGGCLAQGNSRRNGNNGNGNPNNGNSNNGNARGNNGNGNPNNGNANNGTPNNGNSNNGTPNNGNANNGTPNNGNSNNGNGHGNGTPNNGNSNNGTPNNGNANNGTPNNGNANNGTPNNGNSNNGTPNNGNSNENNGNSGSQDEKGSSEARDTSQGDAADRPGSEIKGAGCFSFWSNWGGWLSCNVECGQGTRTRWRQCSHLKRGKCDSFPPCNGPEFESQSCAGSCAGHQTTNQTAGTATPTAVPVTTTESQTDRLCSPLAVQGGWGSWGCWSDCVNGARMRYRNCDSPTPKGVNTYCPGNAIETQNCGAIAPCAAGQDILFIVDASGSIGSYNYYQMVNNLLGLIHNFDLDYSGNTDPAKVRVAIISFSETVKDVKAFNDFTMPANLTYESSTTNTADALWFALNKVFAPGNGNRPANPDTLVLLTDGESANTNNTINEANAVKAAGIRIICLGIGSNLNQKELTAVASNPVTDVLNVNKWSELQAELDKLFQCPN